MILDEPLGRALDAVMRFETRLVSVAAPLARLLDDGPRRAPRALGRRRRRPALAYAAGDIGGNGRQPDLAA